jgi:AraC family transcriptional activator of pobA
MPNIQPHRIKTISEYHQIMGLPKPEHPLISVLNFDEINHLLDNRPPNLIFDFYSIALKRNINAKIKYG